MQQTHKTNNGLAVDTAGDFLESLPAFLARDMERAEVVIRAQLAAPVALVSDLAGHLIGAGGKRMRPMITLAAARMCGGGGAGAFKLAAAVEIMHSATLLHDDVVDEGAARRGMKTARMIWGNRASILVGDFLLGRAFELMVSAGSLPCLDILSRAASMIASGEVMQLSQERKIDISEDAYMEVIGAKTAALFAAAAETGGVLAGGSAGAALRAYGYALGMAFQLIDDLLDYQSGIADTGKEAGADMREGKLTLPALLSYQQSGKEGKAFWRRVIITQESTPEDFTYAVDLMKRQGVLDAVAARARAYTREAIEALAPVKTGEAGQWLEDVSNFCAARTY